jgi:hypothetical protein
MKPLRGSVGRGGNNFKTEIVRIQAMLNVMLPSAGGPTLPLELDDIVGPQTIAAIEGFHEYMEMYHDLTKPSRLQPCGGISWGPMVNLVFCDPDPLNNIGADVNVRAAGLLQAAAREGQDSTFGISNFEWLVSGLVLPGDQIHFSAPYLLFCQKAAGSPAYYFYEDNGGVYSPAFAAVDVTTFHFDGGSP